jgi:hypothetical protein
MATVDFSTIPTDVPLTVENIDRLSLRAAELAMAFANRIGSIEQQIGEARDRFSREAEEIVRETEPANRNVARQFAKQQAATRIIKFKTNIEVSSRAQREEILRPLARLAEDAKFLLSLCHSPAQMLGRVALGETKRTQYQLQLEGAGPVELETAAITAIATEDVVLCAAIVTVIDRRPTNRRPFTAAAFAERAYGATHRQVHAKLQGVILAEKTARAANAEFIRGRADPIMNLSNQLAARAIAEASA